MANVRSFFEKPHSYIHMKYTTGAYEMIRITKRFVTFNKYAGSFNFHNEMKTTVTLSHAMLLCLSQLYETHHACIHIT